MVFIITERPGRAGERSGTIYMMADAAETCRAEVWPFAGMNCLRWQVRAATGDWADLLYVAPDWERHPVPTRSGHPVLFPFPNRLREGRFTVGGRDYQLPRNDPAQHNAIHGFAPRVPWRVAGTAITDSEARITGQFRLSRDAPDCQHLWPADATLTLTYRLTARTLRVEAVVDNPGPETLPFGLGYHPYFAIPGTAVDDLVLQTAATTLWDTQAGLPTGRKLPLPAEYDFRTGRPIGGLGLDHLFGDLNADGEGLRRIARLQGQAGAIEVHADPAFRELVLFIPIHRQAIAIEPYTCATDAANLQSQGVSAGWRELSEGERFLAVTEYRWLPENPSKPD